MRAPASAAAYSEVALARWHSSRSSSVPAPRYRAEPSPPVAAVCLIVGCSLLTAMVGADARWLASLGHEIAKAGRIPAGVPFAAAPTVHWHNVTVLGELVFWALELALGDRGLVLMQAIAVGVAFGVLAREALASGASGQSTASACLWAALGAAPSLVIARAQLFSLALFPVVLSLLRFDSRTRSRRIWLIVPVLALWSNLHGGVLVGLTVSLIYLALRRLRAAPIETIALAICCLMALCANPSGLQAVSYYTGVLSNAAAQRGEGLWGPLSPTSPADLLLLVAAAALALRAARTRPQLWEVVSIGLLGAMTVHAARSGVWLLLALATPAAAGARSGSPWRRRRVLLTAAAIVSLGAGVFRSPNSPGADQRTVTAAIALARGTPILASDIEAEQIALAGGRVWASNPIDAFQRRIQVAYLEWMDGDAAGLAAVDRTVRVVLVRRGSPEAALMKHARAFRVVTSVRTYELLERSTNR